MMKLSEAIREGCKISKPYTKGDYLAIENGELCACAIGAAYLAFENDKENVLEDIEKARNLAHYNCIDLLYMESTTAIPVEALTLYVQIITANDQEVLTREEIADKLEIIGM